MKLQLMETDFSKNFSFHAKITRKCLVCDSTKISTNQSGVSCKSCGTTLGFE